MPEDTPETAPKRTLWFFTKWFIISTITVAIVVTIGLTIYYIPSILEAQRDSQRVNDISTISDALERYYYDNNAYPKALAALTGPYLATMPTDPTTKAPYAYAVSPDAGTYKVCADMEEASRSDVAISSTKTYCVSSSGKASAQTTTYTPFATSHTGSSTTAPAAPMGAKMTTSYSPATTTVAPTY